MLCGARDLVGKLSRTAYIAARRRILSDARIICCPAYIYTYTIAIRNIIINTHEAYAVEPFVYSHSLVACACSQRGVRRPPWGPPSSLGPRGKIQIATLFSLNYAIV